MYSSLKNFKKEIKYRRKVQGLHYLSGYLSDCEYWKGKLFSFLCFWVHFLTKHLVAKGSSSISCDPQQTPCTFWGPTLISWYECECEEISNYTLGFGVFFLNFSVYSCLKQQKCSSSPGKGKRTALCLNDIIKLTLFSLPSASLHIFCNTFFLQHPLKPFEAAEGWW